MDVIKEFLLDGTANRWLVPSSNGALVSLINEDDDVCWREMMGGRTSRCLDEGALVAVKSVRSSEDKSSRMFDLDL